MIHKLISPKKVWIALGLVLLSVFLSPRLWMSKMDKVHPGMSQSEVLELFGPPATVHHICEEEQLWFYIPFPFVSRIFSHKAEKVSNPMRYYMHVGFLFGSNETLVAYTLQGEDQFIYTLSGRVKGDDLINYAYTNSRCAKSKLN